MYMQAGRCYYHPERGAVATCSKCGAGICRECAVKAQGRILCCQCGNEELRQEHRAYRKNLKEAGGRFRRGTEFIVPGIIGILLVAALTAVDYYFGAMDGRMCVNHTFTAIDFAAYLTFIYMLFSTPFGYIALSDFFAPKYDTVWGIFTKWYFKIWIALLIGGIAFTFFWIRFLIGKAVPGKNRMY